MEENKKTDNKENELKEQSKQNESLVVGQKGKNSRNIPTVLFIVKFLNQGKSRRSS